jgi:hypothetical protein
MKKLLLALLLAAITIQAGTVAGAEVISGGTEDKGTNMDLLSLAGTDNTFQYQTVELKIAAFDSKESDKAQSDYTCDGIDDDVEITDAISALPANGGGIYLFGGNYNINIGSVILNKAHISLHGDNNAVLRLADKQKKGCVIGVTEDDCIIEGIKIDGNLSGQTISWANYYFIFLRHVTLQENNWYRSSLP